MDSDIDDFFIQYQINDKTKQLLLQNDVTRLELLLELDEHDLRGIAITLGQAKSIIKGIKKLKETTATPKHEVERFPKVSNTGGGTAGSGPPKLLENINPEWIQQQYGDNPTLPEKLMEYTKNMLGAKASDSTKAKLEAEIDEQTGLHILKCKLTVAYEDKDSEIKKCVTGEATHNMKTILLVGQTGTGKSAIVNGIVNYIFNVSFEENYRIKLVNLSKEEKANAHKGQQVSQTEWITVYTIVPAKETEIQFTLNIVDTPGFADTRGMERDKRLIKQIRDFFTKEANHGINTANGICFVVKASDSRLTGEQQYVFGEIMALFGKNVECNIFIMTTFSDGSPVIFESMKSANISYRKVFQFNNSALYAQPKEAKLITKFYWDFGMESYKTFFDYVKRTHPVSLKLSAKVLRTRETLSAVIDSFHNDIKLWCQKLDANKKNKKALDSHKREIEDGKAFDVEVTEVFTTIVRVKNDTTNCTECKKTCCHGCWITQDKFKYFCWSMNILGNCTSCKCSWKKHANLRSIHELKTRTVTKSYEKVKEDCLNDSCKKDKSKNVNNLDDLLEHDSNTLVQNIWKHIIKARKCQEWLEEYALGKLNNITNGVYIDTLINNERRNPTDGWEERIAILDDIKKRNLTTSLVISKEEEDIEELISNVNVKEFPPEFIKMLKGN